ncbi:MAG: NusA-like transcription termination signal-binding factor [Halobacteriales archaeon]|nr:NusA-like transcription termination signal-binding factor [Halobacteriales archaeon]
MAITLSDTARQYIALFEDVTGATARDCIVDEDEDRVVFVVDAEEMGQAIGPDGQNVRKLEGNIGRDVELVRNGVTAEEFVANALEPAAVYNVTISDGNDGDDRVAYAEVAEEDKGVAIGKSGRNIEMARQLAARHFDIDDIQFA